MQVFTQAEAAAAVFQAISIRTASTPCCSGPWDSGGCGAPACSGMAHAARRWCEAPESVKAGPRPVYRAVESPVPRGNRVRRGRRCTQPGKTGIEVDHPEYILESVKAGAHGYLRKDSLSDQLRVAVQTVARGDTHFGAGGSAHPEPVSPILAGTTSHRLELLTRRERDVLIGVASGKANKEITADLGLSVRTVESYRESLIRKLGIPSAAGLTRFAIEARMLGN